MAYNSLTFCRKYSLVAVLLLLLHRTGAQPGFSAADAWLKENVGYLGGRAVLVVFKDGKLVYNRAENDFSNQQRFLARMMARKQGKDPRDALKNFNSATRERIASCSKWLSAALVMTFVDEGSLRLDDTVGKYLPVMTAGGKSGITISQCLSHLTGIQAGTFRESMEFTKGISSMEGAIDKIAGMPMEGEPGKTFHYSSAGLQIAGTVIEKISGKDFETLFTERIARPCGMINTDFGHGKVPMPAGGGWSTAEDYIKFLSMILNEGSINGNRVLSKNAVIEMQKNRVGKGVTVAYSPAEAGKWGYGFGEWVMDDSTGEKRSDGITSPGLFGSFPWVNNRLKYAGFLLTFNLNSWGRNERYLELKKIIDEAVGGNK